MCWLLFKNTVDWAVVENLDLGIGLEISLDGYSQYLSLQNVLNDNDTKNTISVTDFENEKMIALSAGDVKFYLVLNFSNSAGFHCRYTLFFDLAKKKRCLLITWVSQVFYITKAACIKKIEGIWKFWTQNQNPPIGCRPQKKFFVQTYWVHRNFCPFFFEK